MNQHESLFVDSTENIMHSILGSFLKAEYVNDISVNRGLAMRALYLAEIDAHYGNKNHEKIIVEYLTYAARICSDNIYTTALIDGLTGLAWLISKLQGKYSISWAESFLTSFDVQVTNNFDEKADNLVIDLLYGCAGLALYAITRKDTATGRKLFTKIEKWFIRKYSLIKFEEIKFTPHRENSICGEIDLGMAHGLPGLFSVMAIASKKNMLHDNTKKILQHGLDFIWDQRCTDSMGNIHLPMRVGDDPFTRASWCRGALGASFAFEHARGISEENHKRAKLFMNSCVSHYLFAPKQEIREATVCHGFSGFALLISNFIKQLNSEEIGELYTQAINHSHNEIWRFLSVSNKRISFTYQFHNDVVDSDALLDGRCGISLALLSLKANTRSLLHEILLVDFHD